MLLLLIVPGSQLLIYPILWILMPSEEAAGVLRADSLVGDPGLASE